MLELPPNTYSPGWPEYITDKYGDHYVLLRDGNKTGESTGESCLYGILDPHGFIIRQEQWVPAFDVTLRDMRLTGGPWMDREEFIRYRQTPIELPEEPVTWPYPEPPDEEDELTP